MSYIFISYRSKESDFALRITQELMKNRFPTWFDQYQIKGGDDWVKQLQDGVNKCHILLPIISPDYVSSKYCRRELRRADKLNKIIIPILYKSVPDKSWPIEVQEKQYIDFTGSEVSVLLFDQRINELLEIMTKNLAKSENFLVSQEMGHQPEIKVLEENLDRIQTDLHNCSDESDSFIAKQREKLKERLALQQKSWELANDQLDELIDLSQAPQLERKIQRLTREVSELENKLASLCI